MSNGNGNGNGCHDGYPGPGTVALSDRPPPQNLDAERGVLGGVLLDNAILPEISRFLTAEDFYRDAHQVVYKAMVELHGAGRPVDVVALADLLERRNQLEQVGGDDALCAFISSVPHAVNAKYHAQIVREKSVARQVMSATVDAARDAMRREFTADELLARARGRLDGLWPAAGEPWPELSLQAEPAAEPFPVDVFPLGLRRYCRGVASVTLTPVDLAGCAMLATASAAIGQSSNVIVRRTWREAPLLYLLIVAPPGKAKTPVVRLVVRPLAQIDKSLRDESRLAKQAWEEGKKSMPKGSSPGPAPANRRAIVKDVTRETLIAILANNPRGLLADPDEASAWVSSFNEYKAKGSDRAFWLDLWASSALKYDREGGNRTGFVPHPFVTVLGGLQPDMLGSLSEEHGRDDGFLDRILFCFPAVFPRQRWTEEELDEDDERLWQAVIETLYAQEQHFDPERNETRPAWIGFSSEAKEAFVAFFDQHCDEMESEEDPCPSIGAWSKLRAYAARFSLILSRLRLASKPERPDLGTAPVMLEDVQGSVRLITYFKRQVERVHHRMTGGTGNVETCHVLAWIARQNKPEFRERELQNDLRRRFPDTQSLRAPLQALADASAIRVSSKTSATPRRGRKPSQTWEVNPLLLGGA